MKSMKFVQLKVEEAGFRIFPITGYMFQETKFTADGI